MSKKIEVLSREVRLSGVNDQDYVCLTEIAHRSPAEIMEEISRGDAESAEILERIKALLL